MTPPAGELPVGIASDDGGAVRLFELFHSLRRENSAGIVGSRTDRGGKVTVLVVVRGVGPGSRSRGSREDPGDFDGEVVAQMNDSTGEREPLFPVTLLEMVDLSLNLVDRQRVGWGRVGSHVVHLEEE
jgi:hypothetical protein